MKYAEDGGPSTPDVLRLLSVTDDPRRAVDTFAAMLFFNYLVGAPDAHAKNYSLIHASAHSCVLAPLCDVASGLPYDLTDGPPLRMAMSIGGENRLGHVRGEHLDRFAEVSGMEPERCRNLMANLCGRIPASAHAVFEEACNRKLPGSDELAARLIPKVESHCARTLGQL